MKLNKDQKQKIILGAMLMAGIIYLTNEFLLSPLATECALLTGQMTEDEPKAREMRGKIARARDLATRTPQATKVINQINSMIPDGSPIAWCPPKFVEFFKRYGTENVVARMGNEMPDKELIGYRRLVWSLDIPRVDFATFTHALADLENAEPLFEFTGFDIQAQGDRVDTQHAILTVQNIIKL